MEIIKVPAQSRGIQLFERVGKQRPNRKKDYTGVFSGKLTIISDSGMSNKYGNHVWNAVCDCGNKCVVIPHLVLSGKVSSCGCLNNQDKIRDLSGSKFHMLMIIDMADGTTKKGRVWNAVCDCGNKCVVLGQEVVSGKKKSCGCYAQIVWKLNAEHARVSLKKRMIELYGVEHALQSQEIQKKIKQKYIEKYGTPTNYYDPEVTEKRNRTSMERYGTKFGQHNEQLYAKAQQTSIDRYGFTSPMKNPEVAKKCAKNSTKSVLIPHWKSGEMLTCVASYEVSFVNYMNENRIEFDWQIPVRLKNDILYICDAFVPSFGKTGTWIEIKGYWRGDALKKWEEFSKMRPNSEVWDKKELKSRGII